MDTQSFFHQATLHICSSLEIEKAFGRFFHFIQHHIPAQEAYLHYYDNVLGITHFFVKADADGGSFINRQALWSKELRQLGKTDSLPACFISNHADTDPLSRPFLEALNKSESSIITVRLTLEKDWVGGVSLWAGARDQFSTNDLELLAELRQPVCIALSNYRRYQDLLALKNRLADDYKLLKDELSGRDEGIIIGAGLGLKKVLEMVRQVAPLDSPVLVMGATGTGKELITRTIHSLSTRRDKPFIKVNCGAIADSLMDSELFGHEKGSFTGAMYLKRGRFERAHGGTLFLDEIGELPIKAQVKLLRVLQEKEFERVGGTQPVLADVRLIAATNRDLKGMIRNGTFRRDLYFRLQVFPITVPPLSERICDIPELTYHFMHKKAREMKLPHLPALAHGALENLMTYSWPGNVRELENAVERALILSNGNPLTFSEFIGSPIATMKTSVQPKEIKLSNLDTVVRDHIQNVLVHTHGKIEGRYGAAEILNVNPGTLRHRMRKLGIAFGRKAQKN
ncbi:MAG: sigma 54-interacting transcriptional regulator [Desulfobacteraceae bacterium]|jgi:transcriptional regulator with GAF, ATPase, and Fis domain